MKNIKKITDFVLKHFEKCRIHGGGSRILKLPEFELMPSDYLEFAQNDIDNNSTESLVNCVGHLKRAIDCQVDILLHAIGVYEMFKKNNLKFSTKFEAVELMGMFQSKSLNLLNVIRNKMEHEYVVPKVMDLQAYYELCTAFILVIESNLIILSTYGDPLDWYEEPESKNISDYQTAPGISIVFHQEEASLAYDLMEGGKSTKIVFKPNNKESTVEYLKSFNIFFIICRNDTILSDKQAIKLLKSLQKV